MKRIVWMTGAAAATLAILAAQQSDFTGLIKSGGAGPSLAVPDFRGDGQAQSFMTVFNQTLWNDLDSGGIFKMLPKGSYPVNVPQQLSDFKPAQAANRPGNSGGLSMSDWSSPPTQANYVTVGYAAVQNNSFVLRGWLVDLSIPDLANAGALAKTYIEPLDENGARKGAHEFACDILQKFGATCIFGSHIYFVRRTGTLKAPVAEIWSMDFDGKNQRQLTHYNALSDFPSVSPDGSRIAFTSWVHGSPEILMFSVDPVRDLRFIISGARQ